MHVDEPGAAPPPRSYFTRVDETIFRPTEHVEGAWDVDYQHIAPALGLVAHEIERHRDARRDDGLQLGRVSYDILGPLPIEPVDVRVEVLRPSRTVELVQATLAHGGRPVVLARTWLLAGYDTAALEGGALARIPDPSEVEPIAASEVWPGGFIRSVDVRRREAEPGRAVAWVRSHVDLVADEQVSDTAATLGLVDITNGLTPRRPPEEVLFPNVELTIHLLRRPRRGWLGADTTVAFGATGLGLTHSVLHDEHGPFALSTQTLTVRPR